MQACSKHRLSGQIVGGADFGNTMLFPKSTNGIDTPRSMNKVSAAKINLEMYACVQWAWLHIRGRGSLIRVIRPKPDQRNCLLRPSWLYAIAIYMKNKALESNAWPAW
jgi:hypothetical protein